MRRILRKLSVIASNKKVRFAAKFVCAVALVSVARCALADDSSDLLAGTTTQALKTMNGRSWMYLIQ